MNEYGEFFEAGSVRFRRVLPGPIERVFEHLTDSELRGTWFASGALEPRVGGQLTLQFRHSDFAPESEAVPERFKTETNVVMTARVTRFEPPKVLAFLWDGSEVIFELEPEGERVVLTLTHRKLATRGELLEVCAGWHSHLDVLEHVLHGEKPLSFWARLDPLEGEYAARLP